MGATGQVPTAGVQHPLQCLGSPPLFQVPLEEDGLQDRVGERRERNGARQVDAGEGDVLVMPQPPAAHRLEVRQQAGHLLVLRQHST